MPDMRILVANEPRSYREVIAAAIEALRPHIEVILVTAGDLDREVHRLHPELVLCSQLTPGVKVYPLTWVMLYPEGKTQAIITIAGCSTNVRDLEFDQLLAIIDETEQLTARGYGPATA